MRDVLREILFRKAKAESHAADAAFVIIAAEHFKALHDFAVSFHRLFVMVDSNLLLEFLLAFAEGNDIIKRTQKFLIKRAIAKIRLLLYIADSRGLVKLHRAAVIFFLPQKTAHERRLARAICADKADFIPACHFKIDIMKEFINAKSLLEPCYP